MLSGNHSSSFSFTLAPCCTELTSLLCTLCIHPLGPEVLGELVKNEAFCAGVAPWLWELREKESFGVWRPTCSAFPREPVLWKGIPRAALGCKAPRIRFRKPASGEEVIFLLKPWDSRYEGELRKEVLTLPMYL